MNPRSLLLVAAAMPAIACAQIQIVDTGAAAGQVNLADTYIQDFDTLVNTGFNVYPITLTGWHGGDYAVNSLRGNGSYGTTGSTERALGGGVWAVSFINLSSTEINSVTVTYDGEQWARGSNNPQVIDVVGFDYKVFSAGAGTMSGVAGWTSIPELYFYSPNATATSGVTLDGNAPENRITLSLTFTNIALSPGEEIWFRWFTGDDVFNDHTLAADNVRVSFGAIPEPSAVALWFGFWGILLAATRRRSRNA